MVENDQTKESDGGQRNEQFDDPTAHCVSIFYFLESQFIGDNHENKAQQTENAHGIAH